MPSTPTSPKERALGRALRDARLRAGMDQHYLASAVKISAPEMCRIELGVRHKGTTDYAMLAGMILAHLIPLSEVADEFRTTWRHLTEGHEDTQWVASTTVDRNLQHRAFHDELAGASAVVTVWPTGIPTFVRMPEPKNTPVHVDVLVGEPATGGPPTDEHLRRLSAQGARVHVLPGEVIEQHDLDCAFTVLDTRDGARFAFIDTRVSGTFLHRPCDVDPLAELAATLLDSATRQPPSLTAL